MITYGDLGDYLAEVKNTNLSVWGLRIIQGFENFDDTMEEVRKWKDAKTTSPDR